MEALVAGCLRASGRGIGRLNFSVHWADNPEVAIARVRTSGRTQKPMGLASPTRAPLSQPHAVALVRILIDGYSLLHAWPELAPRAARHSHQAREALIQILTRYRDATATPLTIVFDGQGAPSGTPKLPSSPELEILFSPVGRTADDLIERAAYRFQDYGEVLVVTDDHAERDTVTSFGAHAASCLSFISQVNAAVAEQATDLKRLNRKERERWGHR